MLEKHVRAAEMSTGSSTARRTSVSSARSATAPRSGRPIGGIRSTPEPHRLISTMKGQS